MYATVLELVLMELLVIFQFAILLVLMEFVQLLKLAIVHPLDSLVPFVKFLYAVLIAYMEVFALLLKLAIAKELDGMELLVNSPFALTHASMEIAQDLILVIVQELDMLVPIVIFPSATQDALTLEFVYVPILAIAQQPMDGLDPRALFLFALNLVKMEETALVPMFVAVKEQDSLEINAI